MVNKGRHNQARKPPKNNIRPNLNINEYDVKESIKKFHSYNSRRQAGYFASTNSFSKSESSSDSGVINSNVNISTPTDTGSLYSEYTRLDDKITNITSQNELAHNELRRELETKIKSSKAEIQISISSIKEALDSKLSAKWFSAAIAVLVAIAGIIYTLSYSRQSDSIEQNAADISDLKQDKVKTEKDLEYLKRDIEEIKGKTILDTTIKK